MKQLEHKKSLTQYDGGQVKVLQDYDGLKEDHVAVSGLGVVFSEDHNEEPVRDSYGEYFTRDTWLGHSKGDGVLGMFGHGIPLLHKGFLGAGGADHIIPQKLYDFFDGLAKHRFENPVKTELSQDGDIEGLAATLVLNLRNKYEKWVADQATKGLLGWSSGSAPHVVNIDFSSGKIKQWPIIEFSLTPTPAEHRTYATPTKQIDLPHEMDFLVKSGMIQQEELIDLFDEGTKRSDEVTLTDSDLYYIEQIKAQSISQIERWNQSFT